MFRQTIRLSVSIFVFLIVAAASLSGASAVFQPLDTTTQGNWKGVYGQDGYIIAKDQKVPPAYATMTPAPPLPPSGGTEYLWPAPVPDSRMLLTGASTTVRIPSTYYSNTSFTFDVSLTSGPIQIALYCLDLDTNNTRSQRITVLDGDSNATLDVQTLSNFHNGVWAIWNVQGHVKFQVTRLGELNAVVSGVFFRSLAGGVAPPTVSISTPPGGTVTGTIPVTANATSTLAITSVQFKLDGANLGAPVTGSGPNYTTQWATTGATNGSHALTAVATDSQLQQTTSSPITVTVSNSGTGTGPAATFVKTDTTTKGTWKGTYGQDGYLIPNPPNPDLTKLPSYLPALTPTASAKWNYSTLNTDVRAPQKGDPATDRTASVIYSNPSSTPFSFDVNLSDGLVHQVAVYCVDFDSNARSEVVSILNANDNTLLDSRTISAFNGGVWVVWNLQGHVIIKFASTVASNNAVVSGLFFGPVGAAAPPPTVSMTSPSAGPVSGAVTLTANATSTVGIGSVQFQLDGANLGAPVSGAGPNYTMQWASNTVSNGSHTLRAIATDTQSQGTTSAGVAVTVTNSATLPAVSLTAPTGGTVSGTATVTANATSTLGIASVQFQLDGSNLGAAVTGAGPNYSTSWNTGGASNGTHTLTAIATDTTNQQATSAGVTVTVSNGGTASAATFIKTDTTTKGTWKGTAYGLDGYLIPNPPNPDLTKLPSYLPTLTPTAAAKWNYPTLNADVRAPQKGDPATDRTASVIYSNPSSTPFSFDVNLTDGLVHQVAVYCVDFDSNARGEVISILKASDNTLLDSRTISAFNGGVWVVWNLQGHVIIKFASTVASNNAVVSGLFFSPVGATAPPPTVSMTSPSAGPVSGAVTLTANATSTVGIGSVQFQLDGANLGAPVSGAGPNYTMQWASNTVSNGSHTLRAIATDTQNQGTTSAGVAVTVTNSATLPAVSLTAPTGGAVSGTATVTANATSTLGIASVQFQLDGSNLGAAVTGAGPNYSTSWNTGGASNGTHTLTAIATDTTNQQATSTGVTVTVSNGGTAPAATFVKTDTTTKGTWKSIAYGLDGYLIPNVSSDLTQFPSYLTALPRTGGAEWNYTNLNSDVRAPQKGAPATDRTASVIYTNPSSTPFSFDVNLSDGLVHQVAVYCVDFDSNARGEVISILKASDNTLLDSRTISAFNGGVWVVWNLQGHVIIKFASTVASNNAVVSGLFFSPVGATAPPPTVSMTSPSAGPVSGAVTLTANATSTVGIGSVQFQLDGANLGAPVSGAGPNYTMQWASNTVSNGSHTLRAIATDTQNQGTTSAGVAVTVTNSATLPAVSLTAPTGGTVSGTATVTANATSTLGIASVQFQLDGSNLGAAVTGAGPNYSTSWNTGGASNGTHTLTAIATDTTNQQATSTGVTVTVSNGGTGPAATFVKTDTTTKGTWKGTYGQDGYLIPNPPNADLTKLPSYLPALAPTAAAKWNYSTLNTDVRAPQKGDPATDRIASVIYSNPSSTPFSFDVNLSDGLVHQVAVYCVDFDSNARGEVISILKASDNTLLDSRTISAFNGGVWVVWNLQGHVIIKFASTVASNNAVVSGIFFGANAPPPPPPTVSMTSPGAGAVSGTASLTANANSGVGIASVQFQLDGSNLGAAVTGAGPNYSATWNTLTAGNGSHTLTAIATDTVGQKTTSAGLTVSVSNSGPAPTVSITAPAAGPVSGSLSLTANATTTLAIASVQFKIDGDNLAAPVTGAGPSFTLLWNTFGANNGAHTLTAVATDTIGQQTTSAGVPVTVTNVGPPPPAGQIVNLDKTTAGNWKGVYGQDGYTIPNTPSDFSVAPSWATITYTGPLHYVWPGQSSTTDSRALLKPDPATDRIASTYPTTTSMTWDINISDSLTHQVALYCMDFDSFVRTQTIQVLNANTNAVLASTSISNFHNGVWAVYNIAGHVILKVTNNYPSGNAVAGGIFFGPATAAPPLPTVSVTAPAAGGVSGLVALTANATSSIGLASVQFQLDGTTNIGPALTGAGPSFNTQWNSITATNGPHTLTAIVTDVLGQTVASASVAIVVGNGPPPTVSITAPTAGPVQLQVALSATASSTVGLASVQFRVDGNNLGSAVQGAGPTFQAQWDSTKIANGAHTLTAIATDTFGQQATSAGVAVTVSNPAPVISITSPAGGSVAGATTVTANATSASGIASVQFKLDGVNLGAAVTGAGPNYSTQWSTPASINGTHTLTAIATDLVGQQKTSAAVTVTVANPPPTVSITGPANGSTVGGSVTISATATSAIGMSAVQFQVDGAPLGGPITGAGPSYSALWQTNPGLNGSHTLTVVAADLQGQTALASITVTVSTVAAPTVTITGPTGSVQGTVTVTATATSPVGIGSVQFLVDGTNLGAAVNGAGPYSVSWDTTKLPNGVHTLTALATDTLNQSATSAGVQATVANPAPTVSITSPAASATVFGLVNLSATASSTVGLASVQFKVDGNNIGGPVAGSGPTFTTSWASNQVLNGSHTLTAVATDTQGQPGTSAPVSVNVLNTVSAPASAIFVKSDAGIFTNGTTACPAGGTPRPIYTHVDGSFIGDWQTAYGTFDGAAMTINAGFTGGTGYVTPNLAGGTPYTYTDSSCELTDSRAMQAINNPGSQNRVFSVYFSQTTFTVDLDFNDGQPHLMAVYCFDPEPNANRSETLEIFDTFGVKLDSQTISKFYGGVYLLWNVQGHVVLRVTNTNPNSNAVISGLFFKSFVGSSPANVTVTAPAGGSTVQKAVQVTATATSGAGVAFVKFQLDGADLNTPVTVNGSTYSGQWVTPTAPNGAHTLKAVVVDNSLQASVSPGVAVTVNNGPAPAASATFVATDTTTQGNWIGKFGAEGRLLPCGPNQISPPCPSGLVVNPFYAAVATNSALQFTYGLGPAGSTSPKVLYTPNATQQNESVYYQQFDHNLNTCAIGVSAGCNVPILLDINFQDFGQHQVSLYFLDHGTSQHQTVTILDANNPSTVLNTQTVSFPMTGFYLTWTLQGHVLVQIAETGGVTDASNVVVLSGVFFQTP